MAHTVHTPLVAYPQKSTSSGSEESFGRRFASATMEYMKYVSGATIVALLCMATYALFHSLHKALPNADEWLILVYLFANFTFVVASFFAGRSVATRKLDSVVASLVAKELKRRDFNGLLHGVGNSATRD